MFKLILTKKAKIIYLELKTRAKNTYTLRQKNKNKKSSKIEGLFKQARKTLELLSQNPKHPSLNTHEFSSLDNPIAKQNKVFEAYVQNKTPNAYRIFWCYGPNKNEITIIAITPHP
jgi:hypothetical protein